MGKSFSENPLKSAQKRSKNVSPRDGVTPSQQRALVALVAVWESLLSRKDRANPNDQRSRRVVSRGASQRSQC